MAWPTTDRFRAILGRSHFALTKAEILEEDLVVAELVEPGVLFDGSVSVSRSDIQRRANVSIADRDGSLTPRRVDDLLIPGGRQIRLWRGVRYPDPAPIDVAMGTDRELVPIGTFRYVVAESSRGAVTLTEMYDRSWIVAGNRFENTYTIAKGTLYVEAIISILTEAYPGVPYDFPDSEEVTSKMVFEADTDPWEVMTQLAANLGMRIFFDPMGTCVMRPEADAARDQAVWEFDDTLADNFGLADLAVTWSGQAYNVVVAVSENSDLATPIRGVARDLDPFSPTKYGGLYGARVMFVRDEKISTQAQADSRARKELAGQVGITQQVLVPSLVIPQLEADDIIYARNTRRLVGAKFAADSFDIPLRGTQSMPLQLRARQVSTPEYDVGEIVGLALDASAPVIAVNAVNTVQAVTTASFTPPAGALLLAHWIGDEAGGVVVSNATISDSVGLPWQLFEYRKWEPGVPTGQVAFWGAFVDSSVAMTVTVTNQAASGQRCSALKVYVITGADAADPLGFHNAGSVAVGQSVINATSVATRTGSMGFLGAFDENGSVASVMTPDSGNTMDGTAQVSTDMVYGFDRRTLPDGVGGQSMSLRINVSPTTHEFGVAWCEIIPAVA